MRTSYALILAFLMALTSIATSKSDSTDANVEGKLKTRYDVNGNPINLGLNAKGLHRVTGQGKLVSGLKLITLNTSTADGRQDVSFTDSTSYGGKAWSLALANRAKKYSVLPISGSRFYLVSSDTGDTATVLFEVEGE